MESKWVYAEIPVNEIVPAAINANEMADEMFDQLVRNIVDSGGLSSVVTVYKRKGDGKYVIISGHHRYKAAVEARYPWVPCLWTDESNLSPDEITAIQLSHNSIHGSDNKNVLKKMFESITSVKFKQFAHIDASEIAKVELFKSSVLPVSEHYSVSLILYRADIEAMEDLFGCVDDAMKKHDVVLVADGEDNEEHLLELTKKIRKKYNIKSTNIAFSKILQLAQQAMECDDTGEP